MDELRRAAWELGVDAEDLKNEASRPELAVSLVRWLMQRNRLGELETWLRANRKDVFE